MVGEEFKIENVKVARRYAVSELQQRLNYKQPIIVTKSIMMLGKANLVKMHPDRTFSLVI